MTKSLNHSIERIQLVPSKSVAALQKTSSKEKVSKTEYQLKTFAAEIDKKFLQKDRIISIETPVITDAAMDEYKLVDNNTQQ